MYLPMLKFWYSPLFPPKKCPLEKCCLTVGLVETSAFRSSAESFHCFEMFEDFPPNPKQTIVLVSRRFSATTRVAGWNMSKPPASARASHMEIVLSHFSLVPAVHTLWRLNFPWGSCCLAPGGPLDLLDNVCKLVPWPISLMFHKFWTGPWARAFGDLGVDPFHHLSWLAGNSHHFES